MRGRLWGFFQRDLLIEASSRFSLLLHFINIGVTVTVYIFLSQLVQKESLARWTLTEEGYFPFVVVGMATSGAMITALTGLSRGLQLQRSSGVLKPLLLGQTRPEAVLFLSSLYPLVRAGVDLMIYLLVAWALGGLSLARANVLGAAWVAGLAVVAFGSLGLWAATFTVLFRIGDPFLWVIASSSWLVSGVLYPSSLLPLPLRWAAELLPLTHALRGLRAALLSGASVADLAGPTLFLGAFSLAVVPLGLVVFNIGLHKARVDGTLIGW